MPKSTYDERSIEVLEGLEGVRRKPGMYIDGVDHRGIWQSLKEVITNSLDEGLQGFGKTLTVIMDSKNNRFLVADGGRGIPVGIHETTKISTLTTVLTRLHAGGKLNADNSAYAKGSGGCLAGNTGIKLLNGKIKTIEDLYKSWEKNPKPFWIYSYDLKGTTAFTPKKAVGVYLTKYTDEVCEVTLDNGMVNTVTIDHPFLLFSGKYCEAQKLKKGDRLRALYTGLDKDGYEVHSARGYKGRKIVKGHTRTNRTVAEALGWDIEDKHVHHKKGNKTDNRPNKLKVLDRETHFWEDHTKNGKHNTFRFKNKKILKQKSALMKELNKDPNNGHNAQAGKILRCAVRALKDHRKLTRKSYDASRGWCYPSSETVPFHFDWNTLEKEAKKYLVKYNKTAKFKREVGYKLQSEYAGSPADNYANHFVTKVKIKKLKQKIPVYDLTVEDTHNFLLESGVFVHNTHGVGVSCTNAVSSKLSAYTFRDGKWHKQTFSEGKPTSKVERIKTKELPDVPNFCGKGTIIEFETDKKIFKKAKFQPKEPMKWLRTIAYFFPQVKFTLVLDGKKEEFQQTGGVDSLVKRWLKKADVEPIGKPFFFQSNNVTVVLQWANTDEGNLLGYVNALEVNKGKHVVALNQIILKCFNKYKTKKQEFKTEDLLVGLFGVVNIAMTAPSFGGQTKEKLLSKEGGTLVKEAIESEFDKWLAKNKPFAKSIIERAVNLRNAQKEFSVSKKLAANLQTTKKGLTRLPDKLAVCTNRQKKKYNTIELFIVEGRSAEGSAKQARNNVNQEILPIRGKILNVYKAKEDKIAANVEIADILKSIGYNPKLKDPYSKLTVEYVMLLSDADPDGKHINLLLSGFLQKALRPLIELGKVFAVDAPLFTATYKNKKYFAHTLPDLMKQLPANFSPDNVKRLKGLGESLHPDTLVGRYSTISEIKSTNIFTPHAQTRDFAVIEKEKTEIGTVLSAAGFLMPHPKHPILVFRNWDFEFVEAKDIKTGDFLLIKPNCQDVSNIVFEKLEMEIPNSKIKDLQVLSQIQNNTHAFLDIDMNICMSGLTSTSTNQKVRVSLERGPGWFTANKIIEWCMADHTGEKMTADFFFQSDFFREMKEKVAGFEQKVLTMYAVSGILGLRWTPFLKSEFYSTLSHKQYDISILKNKPSIFPHITDNAFMANNFVVHNCTPAELHEFAFNEKTRRLIKLMPIKGKQVLRFLGMLEAETDLRKELLGLNNAK